MHFLSLTLAYNYLFKLSFLQDSKGHKGLDS